MEKIYKWQYFNLTEWVKYRDVKEKDLKTRIQDLKDNWIKSGNYVQRIIEINSRKVVYQTPCTVSEMGCDLCQNQ